MPKVALKKQSFENIKGFYKPKIKFTILLTYNINIPVKGLF